MVSLIIVANGSGQRFGGNKMLAKIDNDFLINKTIECFSKVEKIKELILVSNKEVFDVIKNKDVIFVDGGKTRSESVKKGLEKVTGDITLIHDGARPFVSNQIIEQVIKNLDENDCVIPSLKITNCLKKITNNKVETVNREEYLESQTPQGFKTEVIKKSYEKAVGDFYDDCQLLENSNYKIKFVEGSYENKKITFLKDIEW
ncbi:IspD/TarI family cytidylyltransferase [Spiroplasma sp. BIUS-1]|uniref:IspD/TarI family cytidylyltransferase n=1 Tax=Spiroplasma sp. BIUS-1 TaxID=216964 RepID=UPI001397E2C2|nr:IspD/TarI family cytidylyltransferase [Spiroplasma sp. BIUS-1]QHX36273.1 2-C-methyl-D-erythritol 4-phosphate cytidylyltransferase [Spiroplasma sp. BIUS-1]